MSSRLLDAAEVMDREDDPFMDNLAALLRVIDKRSRIAPEVTSAAVALAEQYLNSGSVMIVNQSGFAIEDDCDADD